MLSAGNLRAVADLFDGVPLNTDDRPLIEFLAPKYTRVAATFENADWFTGKNLGSFYDTIEKRSAGTTDLLLPPSKEMTDARRAGTALYHYAVAMAQHDDTTANRYQLEVRQLVPDVVLAAGATNSTITIDKAQPDLEQLLKQQEQLRHQLEEMQQRLNALSRSGEK